MKAATLFSGIGAPECAMPHWQWLWHAEIEPFPSAVMAARHPGSVNLGNVLADDFAERAERAGRPDVLVFGSPCQSFSVAGKRLGLADPRGNLALVALALVARLRPSWFVFENVPGLLSSDGGRDFAAFLSTVADIGYFGSWRVLDAQHWGLAQRRERVFFVGSLGDWRGPAAVLSFAESMRGHPPSRRETGQDIAATLTRGAESSGRGGYAGRRREDDVNLVAADIAPPVTSNLYGDHESREGLLVAHAFDARQSDVCQYGDMTGPLDTDGHTMAVAHTLRAKHNLAHREDIDTLIAHTLRGEGFDASEDGTGRGTPLVPAAFDTTQITSKANRSNPKPGDPCRPLCAGAHAPAVARWPAEVAPTLYAKMGKNQGLENQHIDSLGAGHFVPAAMQVRRLTPRECERLQGFADDFTAIEWRGKPAADGPRYRALGNSMAVPVLRWILSRIEAHAAAQELAPCA